MGRRLGRFLALLWNVKEFRIDTFFLLWTITALICSTWEFPSLSRVWVGPRFLHFWGVAMLQNSILLYISKFHIEPPYKLNGSSDVGAYALRKLLHHPYIKGRAFENGCWSVSSCICILDPYEAMDEDEKTRIEADDRAERERQMQVMFGSEPAETEQSLREKEAKKARLDAPARLDANQFLRNGFFQDAAVAKLGGNATRFVIAAYDHWNRPLKNPTLRRRQSSSMWLHIRFDPPTGKDAEILALTKRTCDGMYTTSMQSTSLDRVASFQIKVSLLTMDGGSFARSHALHAACAHRDAAVVQCILQLDPSCLEARC
jgi:hypothetical protein